MSPDARSLRDAPQHRVAFRLKRDEDGYPPADWEHLWVRARGGDRYVVDNTPFFARGVSFGDTITVFEEGGELRYGKTIGRSGHSTLRIIVFDKQRADGVRRELRALGCASELSHVPGLIAVDVPPSVELREVRRYLDEGEGRGEWEYEEADISG